MKVVQKIDILRQGPFSNSRELKIIEKDILEGIKMVTWPIGSKRFYLDPNSRGKGRGEGNGVKLIKENFIYTLKTKNWRSEVRINDWPGFGAFDAIKETKNGIYAVEWETGNISSSHRAMNKICLGVLKKKLIGGTLIIPSQKLYSYLTDRIGNFKELEPYLPLWKETAYSQGAINIIVIEYDGLKPGVPRIPKGTDGRAIS